MDPALLAAKIRERLPWCGLGRWPTPLERSDALADETGLDVLWIKREDRSAPAGGGNKVRALEFLLAGAPARTVFVTLGATGSTHCLATAVHATALSFETVLVHFPQPETHASAAVRAAAQRAARRIVAAPWRAAIPVAVARAWLGAGAVGRPRWIPAGGASGRGALGHLVAGCELAGQLASPPDAIVVPLGSGGTAAGLALAMRVLGWPTRIVAARVAPRLIANAWRVRALGRAAGRRLARHGIAIATDTRAMLVIDALGAGYGTPSPAGEAARAAAAAHGVTLEATYGAKAFATLAALGQQGFRRVVFWHTFAFPGDANNALVPAERGVEGSP